MTDLAALSARGLAKAIRDRKVSSLEATQTAIEQIKACHELTNCIITLEADEALADAKAADAAIAAGTAKGPLAGVPLAHKDMFDRKGKIASWGARIRADKPATEDATVIARFKGAGALQIAALHLTEFAFGPTGTQLRAGPRAQSVGPDAHHWRLVGRHCGIRGLRCDPRRHGLRHRRFAAAARGCLRHRLDQADLGSRQPRRRHAAGAGAGHDRRPRPARRGSRADARVPRRAGPARSGRNQSARSRLCGSPRRPRRRPACRRRRGGGARRASDVQRMLEQVLAILGKLGLQRATCRFPDWQTLDQLVQLVQLPDAAAGHNAHIRTRVQDFGPQVRARLEVGHFIPAVDHMTALRARGTYLQRTLDETFKGLDIAILPILADPLPTIAELDVAGGPQLQTAMGRVVKYTRPVNYLGLPTLALPVPRNGGLPNGIQLIGRPYSEAQLFAIGQAYQREVPPEIARPLK